MQSVCAGILFQAYNRDLKFDLQFFVVNIHLLRKSFFFFILGCIYFFLEIIHIFPLKVKHKFLDFFAMGKRLFLNLLFQVNEKDTKGRFALGTLG